MACKVLAALDFGEPSLEALRQARALAHGVGGTLAVCHVLPAVAGLPLLFPERGLVAEPEQISEDGRTRAALEQRARDELGLELSEVYVERGRPFEEIVRCSENHGAEFIVLGTHGRGALARVALGSVAEDVVRRARCSVLVARAPRRGGVVVAATDLSERSLPVIVAGAEAARRSGAKLLVVSVFDWTGPAAIPAAGVIAPIPALPPPELRMEMRDLLQSTLEQAIAGVGVEGEARVLDGPPAPAIVTCANDLGAELVVVGAPGHRLGSVAERVLRSADCSVLIARAPREG
jgi:nucleotide-binding universal stress UspA family protein